MYGRPRRHHGSWNKIAASSIHTQSLMANQSPLPSKRRKLTGLTACSSSPSSSQLHHGPLLVECSKGRMPRGCITKEYVLHLPPRLTKSAYQILLACDAVPRQWHLEGRFGSRTHKIDKSVNGIPVLHHQDKMTSSEFNNLLETEGVSIVEKEYVRNHRTDLNILEIDARIHPELEPSDFCLPSIFPMCMNADQSYNLPAFSYAEMFGGIGGFGVALDSLGGKCVFYSEIDERCRETYALNFDTPSGCVHGDIYTVPDEAFPQNLDLLVAGFPCQPFTTMGEQPGLACDKGRGRLFEQIVRMLELSKPRGFLLENVPGLLGMKETLSVIMGAFCVAGYRVTAELCSARGLTTTSRKRLFFVGLRTDLVVSKAPDDPNSSSQDTPALSPFDCSFFQFPYIPDLKLCSHDVLEYDTLPTSELDVLRLSQSTWSKLTQNKRWKPSHLAWPNGHCDTLTSHYGNAVGRGDSQLVPSSSPQPPRRFSVRECARIMGFPNTFNFADIRPEQGEMAHRKEGYRMIGNSVCPPLISALAGSVLDAAGVNIEKAILSSEDKNWTAKGRSVAVDLACSALKATPVPLPAGCLVLYDN